MTNVYQLYRLQTIDTAIQETKADLTQILQAQQEPAELIETRQIVEKLASRAQKLRKEAREKELTVGSVNAKHKATTERLYSGRERNPKALQDLQQEAEYLNRHRVELEETLLNVMVDLEEVDTNLAANTNKLTRIEEEWSDQLTWLKTAQLEAASHLNELLQQRQAQVDRVDAKTLTLYERLLKNKRGTAVALVKDEICQGCRVSLDAGSLRAVRLGEITTCRTCGRILYSNS